MKKIFNRIRAFLRWYGAKWTHPLLLFLILTALLGLFSYLLVLDTRMEKWILGALKVTLLLQIGHLAGTGIAGLILLFRKHVGRAFVYWLECGIFFCVTAFILVVGMFAVGFADNDHFADNLQLPENVVLSEPLDDGYQPTWSYQEVSDDFQKQVIDAIGKGPTLKLTDECHIPALERLMATSDGKQKVLDYLAASPDWTLRYNAADHLYATRNSHYSNGLIDYSESHGIFPTTNVQTGKREGIHAQYSIRIYFDGLPRRLFAKGAKDFDCTIRDRKFGNDAITAGTWTKAGSARIFILDESQLPGRQMTVKIAELVDREFESVEKGMDLKKLGKEGFSTEVKIYNGLQGGMYLMDIWCNPGEMGTLSVRAKEITQGTQLSKGRLKEHQVKTYGCSDPNVLFHSQIDFTIYEGNWEQYYGAAFELWFTPDSGKPPRMLWTGNYRIQGWMR